MSKITPEHLARQAVVYIRQSTADQVANNLESQRRQYNLPERARQLGWSDVAVIDDDLGRSGGGVARPGFEKLLATICAGPATAATGTRCWSSAGSSAHSLPMRTAFTIRAIPTTDCCSA
jgi:Resolvase, N terminal domain